MQQEDENDGTGHESFFEQRLFQRVDRFLHDIRAS
jgi:hypothetical protein